MNALGRYPKCDPSYQKFHEWQVTRAKERISRFPLINKLVDNFAGYDGLSYREAKNIIFLKCKDEITTVDLNSLLGVETNGEAEPNHIEYTHLYFDPQPLVLLEKSLEAFDISQRKRDARQSFKTRLSSRDYYDSESAFFEITTAYRIGQKVGISNVDYEYNLPNNTNPDIRVKMDDRDIFLELSSVTESVTSNKIQSICDKLCKHIFERVKSEDSFRLNLYLDTTKLVCRDGKIDEAESLEKITRWIDKFSLYTLSKFNVSIPLMLYRSPGTESYLSNTLYEYLYHPPRVKKMLEEEDAVREWAKKITIKDVASAPFTTISCKNAVDAPSCVVIHEDAMSAPNRELSPLPEPSSITTGDLQQESFFNQIRRKLKSKIEKKQYVQGSPIIFVIKAVLWSSSFEDSNYDFNQIKPIVEEELGPHPEISGALLYHSDYTKGRYIRNPSVKPYADVDSDTRQKIFT